MRLNLIVLMADQHDYRIQTLQNEIDYKTALIFWLIIIISPSIDWFICIGTIVFMILVLYIIIQNVIYWLDKFYNQTGLFCFLLIIVLKFILLIDIYASAIILIIAMLVDLIQRQWFFDWLF